jgi:hypothetical protein
MYLGMTYRETDVLGWSDSNSHLFPGVYLGWKGTSSKLICSDRISPSHWPSLFHVKFEIWYFGIAQMKRKMIAGLTPSQCIFPPSCTMYLFQLYLIVKNEWTDPSLWRMKSLYSITIILWTLYLISYKSDCNHRTLATQLNQFHDYIQCMWNIGQPTEQTP